MKRATAVVLKTFAVALLHAAPNNDAIGAQVVRGVVKSKASGAMLDRAYISAMTEVGGEVGSVTTDDKGRFQLKISSLGKPFVVAVRRLGIMPTQSEVLTLQPSDTINVEFIVEETSSAPIDTFKVKALQSTNERALLDAERRGWRLFSPLEVERHRSQARSIQELLRSWGQPSLMFSTRNGDCVRSTRANNLCLDWVVDGQVVGQNFNMDPKDIYFLALVGRTEAQTQWGSRTPNGAIVIYTRMYGDKIR